MYDFYDFTGWQNSFLQLIGEVTELEPRSCCARGIAHRTPEASEQASYLGITLHEEVEDDDSICTFPDGKWLLAPSFVPVFGFLASAGGAPTTMGVAPLVLCGFPAHPITVFGFPFIVTFEQVVLGTVGCGFLFVVGKWISRRGALEDGRADDFWSSLAVGPLLISGLANLAVAAHPILGFGHMPAQMLIPMHALLALPGAPLQVLALGCLAADEKWTILGVAAGDLVSSLCIVLALQPSIDFKITWTLLVESGFLMAAVGYQLMHGFPVRAQHVSVRCQVRVHTVGEFLVFVRGATLCICALGMLPFSPLSFPRYSFAAFVLTDWVAKVGAGHLLLKDKEALAHATRALSLRARQEAGIPEVVQRNQRPNETFGRRTRLLLNNLMP